jgi:hypothetical protein
MRGTIHKALGRWHGRASLTTLPATGVTFGVAAIAALAISTGGSLFANAATGEVDARELHQRVWIMEQRAHQEAVARAGATEELVAEALGVELGAPDAVLQREKARVHRLTQPSPQIVSTIESTVSFYYCEQGNKGPRGDGGGFCGLMRDETKVYPGAAACAYRHLGQRFRIVGDPSNRIYTCHDTGNAVHGEHRDIWFHSSDEGWKWQAKTGRRVTLEILA